jgi:hypothetical protein
MRKALVLSGLILLAAAPAFAADRCLGRVLNGECFGIVEPDLSDSWNFMSPADTFLDNDYGVHTSPAPDVGIDGLEAYHRTSPIRRGGELRWADPDELEAIEKEQEEEEQGTFGLDE